MNESKLIVIENIFSIYLFKFMLYLYEVWCILVQYNA